MNFIPIIGPIAMFVVLLVVGVVAEPTFAWGLLPAAGFTLLIIVEGQFVTPSIIGQPIGAERARGLAVARILDLDLGADGSGPFVANSDGGVDPPATSVC